VNSQTSDREFPMIIINITNSPLAKAQLGNYHSRRLDKKININSCSDAKKQKKT
jgi:hypothetical protein